ncbi:MAG: hypothetical protein WCJ24_00935 [Candidatus Saccharibacteria bacterium]
MQFLVAFFVGLGVGTWMYSRAMHTTGNNTKSSIIAGVAVGGIAFLVIFTLAKMFLTN